MENGKTGTCGEVTLKGEKQIGLSTSERWKHRSCLRVFEQTNKRQNSVWLFCQCIWGTPSFPSDWRMHCWVIILIWQWRKCRLSVDSIRPLLCFVLLWVNRTLLWSYDCDRPYWCLWAYDWYSMWSKWLGWMYWSKFDWQKSVDIFWWLIWKIYFISLVNKVALGPIHFFACLLFTREHNLEQK